ncbi:MAG: PepSY-associated TM helix domain-containing protein [Bacteroidota bacterium]
MAKKKTSTLKSVFSFLHLWLGLIAGLIILVSMSGAAIFVWEKELTDWYYADLVFNESTPKDRLPASTLYANVSAAYPEKDFTFMQASTAPNRNAVWRTYKSAEEKGWTWPSGVEHYLMVYINPYSGEVLGHIDRRKDWITLSRFLHQTLLLEYDIGTTIIGVAGLIMFFMAISGLILWWPKNKKVLKQRLKIKFSARFKRVNWDIHSVGGFYTYLFLLFFAGTGLVWSYSWWANGIYRLLGNAPEEVFVRPDPPEITAYDFSVAMDQAYTDATVRQPKWHTMYFNIPRPDQEKGTISVGLYYDRSDSWWMNSDYFYYHPQSGELHRTFTHEQKLTGEKWRHSNYYMHVGSIYGWPTKIIAFICALFFATLPITGFLIWYGKQAKKRRPAKRRGYQTA